MKIRKRSTLLMPSTRAKEMDPVVQVCNLVKTYPSPRGPVEVLSGISVSVAPGQTVVLRGVSGSGKSTLLNILGALDTFDSGEARVAGVDLASLPAGERAVFRAESVAFVFQFFNLLPTLSVLENVSLAFATRSVSRRERRTRSLEMLDAVGMADHAQKFPDQLSGGEQQRVSIARAMVKRPRLMLADEPTAALDEANVEKVLEVMHELKRSVGTSLLLATHDPVVARFADVEWHLAGGMIDVGRQA